MDMLRPEGRASKVRLIQSARNEFDYAPRGEGGFNVKEVYINRRFASRDGNDFAGSESNRKNYWHSDRFDRRGSAGSTGYAGQRRNTREARGPDQRERHLPDLIYQPRPIQLRRGSAELSTVRAASDVSDGAGAATGPEAGAWADL